MTRAPVSPTGRSRPAGSPIGERGGSWAARAAPHEGRRRRPVQVPPSYEMLGALQAPNGPVYIHPDDRKYGLLAAGGQGTGKTSLLLRLYLSDLRDPNCAPIIVDPKSELARIALEYTPLTCGKKVWYLDLGRPMFGMSPLRLDPSRSLPEQASAIADNVVQAISDTAEGQVFQSSRRYLYHAVIGALAIAHRQGRMAMFEDVFALLLPAREDLREQAVAACQEFADLDHTTEFFRLTLPDELEANRSNTYQRLDPPRNKIETILASPSLRRFYNHPTDISLGDIIRARDVLILDANMGALGEVNAQVVMLLFFQQMHSFMQQQVHLPPEQRARVPVILDEAMYVANMTTIKQAATHREAGLELAMGVQYIAQLGARAESPAVTEMIRKGVTNLLQSRCLFRMSDPDDAEQQTRVAMSVYQTMIRADLESRELMGTTPEESIYLPVHYCLSSLIAMGARVPRFFGETYSFRKLRNGPWAQHHMRVLEEAVGPYPETMPKTYKRLGSSTGAADDPPEPKAPVSDTRREAPPPAAGGQDGAATEDPTDGDGGRQVEQVRPLIREAGEVPEVRRSPLREIVGSEPAPDGEPGVREVSEGLREIAALIDPLLGIRRAEHADPPDKLPRLYKQDFEILALLDRGGMVPAGLIRRAVMPDVAERTMRARMNKLLSNGLVERWPIVLRDPPRGAIPPLFSISRYGLQVAQARQPAAIPPAREFREQEAEKDGHVRHDAHTISWVVELRRLLGPQATEKWRTPRWPAGALPVPKIGNGRARRPITLKDVKHAKHIGIFDLASEDVARLEPDAICEIHLLEDGLTFDLIVELDLTERVNYNLPKFKRYDTFLAGWWEELRRYQQIGTRPVVVFVCTGAEVARAYAVAADEALQGSVGVTGTPAHERYYPAREHIFFADEADIYSDDLSVLALPALPPRVREALDGTREPALERVRLLPDRVVRAGRKRPKT